MHALVPAVIRVLTVWFSTFMAWFVVTQLAGAVASHLATRVVGFDLGKERDLAVAANPVAARRDRLSRLFFNAGPVGIVLAVVVLVLVELGR